MSVQRELRRGELPVKASTLFAGSTACLFACIACGGQAQTADTLDPSTPAFGLSTDQQKLFCDWVADQYGGYGESIKCDGGLSEGTVSGPTGPGRVRRSIRAGRRQIQIVSGQPRTGADLPEVADHQHVRRAARHPARRMHRGRRTAVLGGLGRRPEASSCPPGGN